MTRLKINSLKLFTIRKKWITYPRASFLSVSNLSSAICWRLDEVTSWFSATVMARELWDSVRFMTISVRLARDMVGQLSGLSWLGRNSNVSRGDKNIFTLGRGLIGWDKFLLKCDWIFMGDITRGERMEDEDKLSMKTARRGQEKRGLPRRKNKISHVSSYFIIY